MHDQAIHAFIVNDFSSERPHSGRGFGGKKILEFRCDEAIASIPSVASVASVAVTFAHRGHAATARGDAFLPERRIRGLLRWSDIGGVCGRLNHIRG